MNWPILRLSRALICFLYLLVHPHNFASLYTWQYKPFIPLICIEFSLVFINILSVTVRREGGRDVIVHMVGVSSSFIVNKLFYIFFFMGGWGIPKIK